MDTYFSRLAGLVVMLFLFAALGIPGALAGTEKEVVDELNTIKKVYTVQRGDNLSTIAKKFDVNLKYLIRANNLQTTIIHPGQQLVIPPQNRGDIIQLSRGTVTRDELMLMARAIYAEARGESFLGQVAVGAVILNRVHSPFFPNTIREVIMQRNKHTFQFTPVSNGTINLEPDETAIKAALEALKGNDPTGGALFFYNPAISTDQWITTLPVVAKIGRHVFATKP